MRMKKGWMVIGFTMMFYTFITLSNPINGFISDVKNMDGHVRDEPLAGQAFVRFEGQLDDSKLMEKIKAQAKLMRIEPTDAVIDPVWKAIPGYNGLKVDVTQTYRLAKSSRIGKISYVHNEVVPSINLSDLPLQPIYKGNPRKPMVSIMVNVAWGDEYISSILKTFADANVHATFFFDGTWLSKHTEMALEIKKQGHELSNHAYSHKDMSNLSRMAATEEIAKTEHLLDQLGVDNKLFAPPSGDFDDETVQIAHELGLQTILWTIDTVDWRKPRPEWIIQKVSKALEPGSMILMHPTASSSTALPQIIQIIKSKGWVIDTVSELISTKRVMNIEPSGDF